MATGQKRRSILVVDDEDSVREAVCRILNKGPYDAAGASSGPDALFKASQEQFDAVILDIRMPEMSGVDLLPLMRKLCPDTIVIILSAVVLSSVSHSEPWFQAIANTEGVSAYLKKPINAENLRSTLEWAFSQE